MHQVDINDRKTIQRLGYKNARFIGCPRGDKGEINPHVATFHLGGDRFVSVIHVKPVYFETLQGYWRPLSEITSHHGNQLITLNKYWRRASIQYVDWLIKRQAILGQKLSLPTPFGDTILQNLARPVVQCGLTITTVFPDPDPETTTVDGDVFNGAGNATYLTNWNAAGDTARPSDATVLVGQQLFSGLYYQYRAITLFNTAAIGTDTINSATYSIVPDSFGTGTNFNVRVVSTTPASNTNLVAADYQQLSTVNGGESGSTSGMTAGTYTDITLNATGIGYINKTGVTKLGCRSNREADQTVPPNTEYLFWRTADTAGTGSDPKLVVDHTASGAASGSRLTLMGIGS